jgi:hypothetical protein
MDWLTQANAAAADVGAWIARVGSRWEESCGTPWTNQDLLGHLSAWSDFLLDQVEALLADRAGAIARIDVDEWNAAQVEMRRGQAVGDTIAEWRRAVQRVNDVAPGLTSAALHRRWRVAWSDDPASVDDLLALWLAHIDQHRSRLAGP